MEGSAHHAKISATIAPHLLSELDQLVQLKEYASRSEAIEAAIAELLRAKMDAVIEAEVSKLNRQDEITEAEWGMDDYATIVTASRGCVSDKVVPSRRT